MNNSVGKFKNLGNNYKNVSIADYLPDDSRSDLERAEELLENEDFLHLAEKQAEVRAKIGTTFRSAVQLDEYQNDVVAYLEDMEGQKYKVGELEMQGLVFNWENPEPIEF